MKAVLTRVSEASVTVDDEVVGSITNGVLALVGIGRDDAPDAWQTMVRKIAELRILPGERSVVGGGGHRLLLVSQFHAFGADGEGAAASWSDAAPGEAAKMVMEKIAAGLRERGIVVEEGRFGAMMSVASVNEGPVTLLVEC